MRTRRLFLAATILALGATDEGWSGIEIPADFDYFSVSRYLCTRISLPMILKR